MKEMKFRQPQINIIEKLSAELLVANRQLEEQREQLLRSEKARNEMLANISHDLRAPSTALRCAIDNILECPDIPRNEMEMLMGVMDRRMSVLEHLLGDLELISAMDRPEFAMNMETLDIAELLREYFAIQTADKIFAGYVLRSEIPEGLTVWINADCRYLIRVMDNLFGNAARYSKDGGKITLGCRLEGGEAEVYVRDNGIGVDPGNRELIFERCRTVAPARTPEGKSGHGLGLSIAQSIVEKHGGRIWCESRPGDGSIFRFRLPLCGNIYDQK